MGGRPQKTGGILAPPEADVGPRLCLVYSDTFCEVYTPIRYGGGQCFDYSSADTFKTE